MLPRVDADDGFVFAGDRILVLYFFLFSTSAPHHDRVRETNGQSNDLEVACLRVLHKPGPSATLDSRQIGVEYLLEVVIGPPSFRDGPHEFAGGKRSAAATLRGQILPKEGVVDVSSV